MSKFPSTSSIFLLGLVETNSSNISVVKGETMKAKSSKESIIMVTICREKEYREEPLALKERGSSLALGLRKIPLVE
jgi:hypothetical protein